MFGGQSLVLGIGLILAGLVFVLLVWSLLRLVPRIRPTSAQIEPRLEPVEIAKHDDAVLIVQPGGRVEYLNDAARGWFDLVEGEPPNLERLARRARPGEDFLELCATQGQARFSINGRLVEGTSYFIPGQIPLVLVSLRRAETPAVFAPESESVSGSVLRIITDFGRAIAASLDLEATLGAILENVERLVPSDVMEIKVWDANAQYLTAYRFSGLPGVTRSLERVRESQFGEYSNYLVAEKQPLFISDTQSPEAPVRYHQEGIRIAPMRSYIGVPLVAGGDLVGTLEVGILAAEGFAREDLELLRLITGQAAIAIHNALLYGEQQRRASELSGLANLAQSVGSLRDTRELFTHLVQSLSPLFDVEILGFVTYDETHRELQGQVPFQGMPDQFVEIYNAPVQPDSAAERLINSQGIIQATSAAADERWADLGLQDLALAASIRNATLIPLISSGRFLGYLQLANHRKGLQTLSEEELRLLNIVATQTAAIIENAMLVQETRSRIQRSEALRRIASLVSSSATLDEVLRYAVRELAQLLQADIGVIFLYDEQQGVLRTHLDSLYGVTPDANDPLARLFVAPEQFHLTVTGSQQPFFSGNLSDDPRVLPLYQPLIRRFGSESTIVVPLISRERGVGEMMIVSRQANFFNDSDMQLAMTVAGQLAITVEGSLSAGITDESLLRRSEQLVAVSRIVREMNATSELKPLLQVIYDESLRTTRAECGMIALFEREDVPAGEAEGYRIAMSAGHEAPLELSALELDVLKRGKLTVIDDFALSEFRPPHANVKSTLVVPISNQGQTLGLIHLHSSKPEQFGTAEAEILETLSVQAAIAIGNTQRYHEQAHLGELLHRRVETLSKLVDISQALRTDQPLEQSLQIIGQAIHDATPFQMILFSVYEPESGLLRRVTGVGVTRDQLMTLKAHQQPWTGVSQLLKPEFKIGEGYFIPAEQTPVVPPDVHMLTVLPATDVKSPECWDPEDILLFPLNDAEGNPLGLMSLDAPRDGMRPDLSTMEMLDIFATQATLAVGSGRRVVHLRSQVEELSGEVERQRSMLSISQSYLPSLLHKDLEQTIAVTHLDQRNRRIRAGLAITETLSRQFEYTSALLALGQEMLTQLDMTISIVAEDTADGPRILHVLGNIPRGTNPEALFGQRNPLRTALQTGETIIAPNLDDDETWHDTPLLNALRTKSFICFPVVKGSKAAAAALSINLEPMPPMAAEDLQVFFQLGRQISIILQNISLLNETRQRLQEVNLLLDFSRQLSGLDPASIVGALLDNALRVIAGAHAGVVLLWEERQELLVPQAAENYADNDSIMAIPYGMGEGLPGRVFEERASRRISEVNFAADYNLPAESLLKYRKATSGRLPVSCMLIPIQTSDRMLGVMALDNFNTPAAFTPEDEALLLSLTQQVALSLDNVRLMQATQERAGQLQALNEMAATITSSLKREDLVKSLLEQMSAIIAYDTAILWLRTGEQLVVAAARGFPDDEQRHGLTVAVEDSALLNEMIRTGRAISVGDVRGDAHFPTLVEDPNLSWLGIPLIAKGEAIGVIALEKAEAQYYTAEQVQLATTFASQAAVALDNASLYEDSLRRAAELDERSQRLALLNRFSADLAGSLNADQVLRLTAEQLLSALNGWRVWVVLLGEGSKAYLQNVLPEGPGKFTLRPLPASPLFDRLRESMGIFTTDEVDQEPDLAPFKDQLEDVRAMMVVPLSSGPNVYALFIQTEAPYHFSPIEIELARTIGNQASIALQNAHLYQSTLSTAERLAILNEASYKIGASLNPEDTYKAIHEAVGRLMPVDAFVIALVDEEKGDVDGVYIFDSGQRISGVRLPFGEGMAGKVIASGEPLLTVKSSEAEEQGGVTVGEKGTPNSILAVPMFAGGNVIGSLSAQSYQYNAYNDEDKQLLSTLANQATVAIQNGRLFAETQNFATTLEQRVIERTAELQREQRNTETLLRILTEVSGSLDLDRALSRTLALLNEAIGAEQGTIMLLHAEDNLLHYRAGYGYASGTEERQPASESPVTLKIGQGLAGWVVKQRQGVLVEDLTQDPRWVVNPESSQQHRSAVVAPLIVGEDVIGAIMVFHRQVGFFTDDVMEMVQAIGSQVAISINNAQLYELIRDQAERLGMMLRSQQVSASQSQAILESVADGVLVTDPSNAISFLNDSAQRILNLAQQDVLGQSLEDFSGLFGRATQAWIETIRTWSENPAEHKAGENYAEQVTLETGQVILVNLAPVIWRNEFLGTVSIFRDITREVEVDRLKSEFVATVSHELRTPMTSIRGYVDILLMGAAGALNENQKHFLDIVKNNTERLNILVNDLLDISRIEAGRVTLSMQAIDLRGMVDDVIADVQRRAQEESRPMKVTLRAPRKVDRVLGDVERVRQILDNLVDNAYHYTPPEGRITIHLRPNGKEVEVDVEDTGIGIPPGDQDRIFERFFRGEDPLVLATPGTGLGLSIVKQLVEMHHGKIWMKSTGIPGKGSTFSFTLPVYEAEE
jgi:PAS domain S-box-containing protein